MKPTNEQLKDVKWWDANQPKGMKVWIEHNAPEANNQSGWFFIKPLGGESYTSVGGHVIFPLEFSADIGTIHHKPKPYQPEVGKECEVLYGCSWHTCLFLGEILYGDYGYQIISGEYKGEMNGDKDLSHFRPIESYEEFFLEAAKELIPEMDADDIRLVKELAKVGARFK